MSKPVIWTEDMIRALREKRAEGKSVFDCAEEIGVGYRVALNKAQELDIAKRNRRGCSPGTTALRSAAE